MPYVPTVWTSGVTPVDAAEMNNLEIQYAQAMADMSKSGSYAGDDSVNKAIPHGLGVVPKLIIIKDTGGATFRSFSIFAGSAVIDCMRGGTAAFNQLAVTNPGVTNFYIGNATSYADSANSSGSGTYYWVAIR